MKRVHRITLTGADLIEAINEFLSLHGEDPPAKAKYRLLTQATIQQTEKVGLRDSLKYEVLEVYWPSEDHEEE